MATLYISQVILTFTLSFFLSFFVHLLLKSILAAHSLERSTCHCIQLSVSVSPPITQEGSFSLAATSISGTTAQSSVSSSQPVYRIPLLLAPLQTAAVVLTVQNHKIYCGKITQGVYTFDPGHIDVFVVWWLKNREDRGFFLSYQ